MASIAICRNVIFSNRSGSKCLMKHWKFQHNLKFRLLSNQTINQSVTGSNVDNQTKSPFDKLDLTFTDSKEAYKSKKTSELIRAYLVLKLSSFDYIVLNHDKVAF